MMYHSIQLATAIAKTLNVKTFVALSTLEELGYEPKELTAGDIMNWTSKVGRRVFFNK